MSREFSVSEQEHIRVRNENEAMRRDRQRLEEEGPQVQPLNRMGLARCTPEYWEAMKAMPYEPLTEEDIDRMATLYLERQTEGHQKHRIPPHEL